MGANINPFMLQSLLAQAAGNAQRCGQSTGEMSATGYVLIAAVFHLGGKICVSGTGAIFQF